jgi:putative ABC transport system permease protein
VVNQMLRAAGRLIRADLAQRPLHTALTGLVIAIAAGALLATLHLRAALDEPYADLMRATNGAHVFVTGPRDALARAAALPEVAQAGRIRRLVTVRAGLRPAMGRVTLAGLPERADVDRPLVVAGRGLRGPGEVVLDRPLAFAHGLAPGGDLPLAGGGRLKVVGVAVVAGPGAGGWVTPEQARALAAPARGGAVRPAIASTIPLRLRDPDASKGVAARLASLPGVRVAEWQQARDEFIDESRRTLAILGASTLLALLAAGFTLATAIGGRVLAERRRIGLLRAVGVTPRGVTGVLVGHYLALALVAAPFGLAAGRLVAPGLLADTADLLGIPAPGPPGPGPAALALGVVLAAVALACALPAWRAGRLPPVVALQPGRPAPAERASRVARLARALRLPVPFVIGAKDAYVQRGRSALTVASLALAGMVVVCALAFEATMDRLAAEPALRAQPWDLAVNAGGAAPSRVERLLRAAPGVEVVGRRYEIPVVAGGVELDARALDGPPAAFAFAVPDGRGVQRAGEVTLGRGALEALGAAIGDRVTLSAGGRRFEVRVVGRHVEPATDGRGAVLTTASLPVRPATRPTWIVRLRDGADPVAAQLALERRGEGLLVVDRPLESLEAEIDEMRPVVYGVCALLLAIAGVNLLTTLVLGVRERRRDVAILRAVGATRRQLMGTVVAGGVLLALPAVAAGLPLGAWLFTTVIRITDPADGPDVATLPSWWTVSLAIPAALAVVAAVSMVAAREASRVVAAVALRAE